MLDTVGRYDDGSPMYVGRDGQPMTLRQWSDAFHDSAGRTVARTVISDDCVVVTMWIGFVYDPWQDPPLIYGTLARFTNGHNQEIESATERDALAVHWRMVGRLRSALVRPS